MEIRRVSDATVTDISLVSEPAMGEHICNNLVCDVMDDNTFTTVVLTADKKIYRSTGTERFIYFPQSTVEKSAHDYLSREDRTLSLNHEDIANEEMELLESWIDGKKWKVKIKVSDNILESIKSGELRGLSVSVPKAIEEVVLDISESNVEWVAKAVSLPMHIKMEIFGEEF